MSHSPSVVIWEQFQGQRPDQLCVCVWGGGVGECPHVYCMCDIPVSNWMCVGVVYRWINSAGVFNSVQPR